jgi:hypothetical protein
MNGFRITGLLDLIHSDVPFPLQFRECEFTGEIWLKGARLRSLSFRRCRLRGLNASSGQIDTNVLITDGSECVGEVDFRGSRIGGDLRTDQAKFSGNQSPSLICDRTNVSGGVFLSRANRESKFNGEVRFSGAEIGGNFDCESAEFSNPQGNALTAERMKAGGGVFLRKGRGCGKISLLACSIGTAFDCRGAIFSSPSERTLDLEKTTVGGHALLDGEFACDTVSLVAATIHGGLRCRMAKIGKLDLRHARIEGPFEWADTIEPSASTLDLRDSYMESIKDDEASWPRKGALHLDGLRFDRFSDSVIDVQKRLSWLRLDNSGPAQAYWQLSQVYIRGGRSDFAQDVLYEFEKLTRERQVGTAARVWNFLLKWTIGFGYKLWRAALLMLVLTLIGFGVAVLGYQTKLIAPTDKDANAVFTKTGGTPPHYARFSASAYSIEHSLPGINFGIASTWSADTSADWPPHSSVGPFVRYWFWLQTLLGWFLSVFFVAGLSGVVKTRQ